MASTIIIKNGTGSAEPSSLTQGELAINVDNGALFYGTSGSSNAVSSSFTFSRLTVNGTISASGGVVADNITLANDAVINGDLINFESSDAANGPTLRLKDTTNDFFTDINMDNSFHIDASHHSAMNFGISTNKHDAGASLGSTADSVTNHLYLDGGTGETVIHGPILFGNNHEIAHVTASGNISSSGNIISNETTTTTVRAANGNGLIHDKKIWIAPTDFDTVSLDGINRGIIQNNGGNLADTGRRLIFYAQKYIPTGWKATAVKIEGSLTSDRFTVYSSSFDVGTSIAVSPATAVGTEVSFASAIAGGGGLYLSIEWGSRGSTEVYGGYIQLTEN